MKLIIYSFILFFSHSLQGNCLKGNCEAGKGKYKFPDGSIFTGYFQNSKPHGHGQIIYKNNDRYDGDFRQGMRHGEGKYIYQSGTKYAGQFRQDKFSGKGKATFSNGITYQGEWSNNRFHGNGTLIYKNGERYVGEFVQGKRHGKGNFYKANNTQITGIWKNDRMIRKISKKPSVPIAKLKNRKVTSPSAGQKDCNKQYCHEEDGRYTYMDGSYYLGYFVEGRAEGVGVCYYANGDIYRGEWNNHGPDGEGIMTFANGKKYSALWKDGKPVKQLYQKPNLAKHKKRKKTKSADGQVDIYALIIGISAYNHLPVLKYTDDDAYQLYAFLKSPEGGALSDNHITLLIDEAATKKSIELSMQDLFEKADQDDVVILYYSGHGLQGRFLPIDFDGYNNSLSHEELYRLMSLSQAKNKILIADACYAGSLEKGEKGKLNLSIDRLYNKIEESTGGSAVLMSSKAEEVSLEYSGLRQGVFSHFLMKGLHGWADQDQDQIITISELYNYVHKNVRSYTGNRQTPTMSGQHDWKMPVGMVR